MRFFKKAGPKTPIWLPTGEPLVFQSLDDRTGYLATDDIGILSQLSKCIKEGRGAVEEIQEDEYTAFVSQKKSGNNFAPARDRQAFGGGNIPDTVNPRVAPPVDAIPVAIEPSAVPAKSIVTAAPIDANHARSSRKTGKKPTLEPPSS